MKIELNIKFEDCKIIGDLKDNISGEVYFDEFGVITKTFINSSSLGTRKSGKETAKLLLKETAEKAREGLMRNLTNRLLEREQPEPSMRGMD